MTDSAQRMCPYCHLPMARWANPQLACWDGEYQLVCFNDQCPYFLRGWDWMASHFHVRASYRHRVDPQTGDSGPLPVWSRSALRDLILAEEEVTHA
jgi:hypothetical protein